MEQRIEAEFEERLILFCEDCNEMRRYGWGLTWYCLECGGGDLSHEQLKEILDPFNGSEE